MDVRRIFCIVFCLSKVIEWPISPNKKGIYWLKFSPLVYRIKFISVGLLVTSFFSFISPTEAASDSRFALVIGNSAYQYAATLTNPKNDSADINGNKPDDKMILTGQKIDYEQR